MSCCQNDVSNCVVLNLVCCASIGFEVSLCHGGNRGGGRSCFAFNFNQFCLLFPAFSLILSWDHVVETTRAITLNDTLCVRRGVVGEPALAMVKFVKIAAAYSTMTLTFLMALKKKNVT